VTAPCIGTSDVIYARMVLKRDLRGFRKGASRRHVITPFETAYVTRT
jgi:hypothetical protein